MSNFNSTNRHYTQVLAKNYDHDINVILRRSNTSESKVVNFAKIFIWEENKIESKFVADIILGFSFSKG